MTSYRSFALLAVVVYLSVVVLFHAQLRLNGTGNQTYFLPDETQHRITRLSTTASVKSTISLVANASISSDPDTRLFDLRAVPVFRHCSGQYNGSISSTFQSVGKHYVFSAYFDDRGVTATLRIIALLRNDGRTQPTFTCHVTAAGNKDERDSVANDVRKWSVSAELYEMCENHAKEYGGWILSCRLPAEFKVLRPPCEVTVSSSETTSETAVLPVYRLSNDTARQQLAVCLPPLFGHVPSTTVVEFIELSRLLGIYHIIVYQVTQLTAEVLTLSLR